MIWSENIFYKFLDKTVLEKNRNLDTLPENVDISRFGANTKDPRTEVINAITIPTNDLMEILKFQQILLASFENLSQQLESLVGVEPEKFNMKYGLNTVKMFTNILKKSNDNPIIEEIKIHNLPNLQDINSKLIDAEHPDNDFKKKCESLIESINLIKEETIRINNPRNKSPEPKENQTASLIKMNEYSIDLIPIKFDKLFNELKDSIKKNSNYSELVESKRVKTFKDTIEQNLLKINPAFKETLKQHFTDFQNALIAVNNLLEKYSSDANSRKAGKVIRPLFKYANTPKLQSEELLGSKVGTETMLKALMGYNTDNNLLGRLRYKDRSGLQLTKVSLREICDEMKGGSFVLPPADKSVLNSENSSPILKAVQKKQEKSKANGIYFDGIIAKYIDMRKLKLTKIKKDFFNLLNYFNSELVTENQTIKKPPQLTGSIDLSSKLDSILNSDESNEEQLLKASLVLKSEKDKQVKFDENLEQKLNKLFTKLQMASSSLDSLVDKEFRLFEFEEKFLSKQETLNNFILISSVCKDLSDFIEKQKELQAQEIQKLPEVLKCFQDSALGKLMVVADQVGLTRQNLTQIEKKVEPFIRFLKIKSIRDNIDYNPVTDQVNVEREKVKRDLSKVFREWQPKLKDKELNTIIGTLCSYGTIPKLVALDENNNLLALLANADGTLDLFTGKQNKLDEGYYFLNQSEHILSDPDVSNG